ncbi:MAG TPA: hypothetical protein VFS43_20860 [Polyangiaceae bacterium]|nr:hypothetical protein [Polyangiaceae bacterium]
MRALRSAGYASVALDLIADEGLSARLRRLGFLRRLQARSFVVRPLDLEGAAIEAVANPRHWHIIDGDLDI